MRHVLKKSINTIVSEKTGKLISEKGLLNGIKRLGIAVSGGSDSIALLYIMTEQCRKSGITPFVLHFDHSLRGEDSRQDALFVQIQAQKLGTEFITERATGITQGAGKSLEMAAREARQSFFRRATEKFALDAIATGHHADDVAETLIMRLLRGAGTDGLSGLKPASVIAGDSPIRFIRPLLRLRRDELRQWLEERGLSWREDATNSDTSITRNNVRHEIIPFLCKDSGRNDDPVNALTRSAEILREDDDCLDAIARQWISSEFRVQSSEPGKDIGEEKVKKDVAHFPKIFPLARLTSSMHLALQRRILRIWLIENVSPEAAGFETVTRILSSDTGIITLPGEIRAEIENGIIRILPQTSCDNILRDAILAPGSSVSFGPFTLSAELSDKIIRQRESFFSNVTSCSLSANAVSGRALTVRTRHHGDRMAPYGIGGTKKVKDIFIDAKLPEHLRDTWPIVLCGEKIVWIPGYRIAADFAASDNEPTLLIKAFST